MNKLEKKYVIIYLIILIMFIVSTLFIGYHHEPWADEAQAWLIARDASVSEIFTNVMRYEGTPPLWHLLLKFLITLGFKYEYLFLIPIIFSSIGIGLFLFKIDVPLYIKVMLPFTYFIFYEYTIKARNYAMIFPVLVGICIIYKNRREHIYLYNFLLGILSLISLHTFIISALLAIHDFTMGFENKELTKKENISYYLLFMLYVIMLFMLFIPEDIYITFNLSSTLKGKANILNVICFSLKRIEEAFILNSNRTIFGFLAYIPFILILFFIVLRKNSKKLMFLSIFGAVTGFMVLVRISIHHIGLVLFTFLFTVYLIKEEIYYKKALKVILIITFVIQIGWSIETSIADVKYNYSAARDLSNYIKTLDYKNMKIYASGYYQNALLPYFDENIFYNDRGGKTYYIWSINNTDLVKSTKVNEQYNVEEELVDNPDMIILYDNETVLESGYKQFLEDIRKLDGYKETHFDGNILFKCRTDAISGIDNEGYYVFERIK